MLINNKAIIKSKNMHLNTLKEETKNLSFEVLQAKNGENTLTITKDSQVLSYHSRYNPTQEAQAFLKKMINEQTNYVLFIGIGLGYVIKELDEHYPHITYSIYEPDESIMQCFLSTFDLSKVKLKNIDEMFSHPNQIANLEKFYLKLAEQNAQVIVTPVAQKIYEEEIKTLISNFKNYLEQQKSSTITDLCFQTRWTINSIVNFAENLQTPNFFKHADLTAFRDKPALIVAAGPSLDEEIENIRLVKENGKAYIFAVGSAVNTLIKHNIMPDALFSYDPTAKNAEVVKQVKELNLQIPLIYGTSIGFEVLKDYPGKKWHFFTTQDSISPNLINHQSNVIIPDAPTVAAIALYILGGIGMGPIILVGQNLAITKEKTYADGISYVGDTVVTDDTLKGYIPMMSTTNEEVYTQQGYLEMRDVIQYYIQSRGLQGKVYNTTKNGLNIEGAPFITLSELIETRLQEDNIVKPLHFSENDYNIEEALANFSQFEEDFDRLIRDFKKLVDVDKKIRDAYKKKLINNAKSYFDEFDKYFNKIEQSSFFLKVIAPTTRNQYKELVLKSEKVKVENRPLQKMEKYINTYSKYIKTIYVAIVEIQPAFAELKKSDLFKKEDSK